MNFISVCKNVIQQNNKKNWEEPEPPIRVSNSKNGKAVSRHFSFGILDKDANIVARIRTTKDGKPLIKAGAKVVIETVYEGVNLD